VKEATVFAVGGAALGGVVAAPVMVAGTIVGLAGYAIKNVLSN
jgi:hypothetical protein